MPPLPRDEEILAAIVALGDDGFVRRRDLILSFRRTGERDLRRAIGRGARRGLILERKDPEGRGFLAVSSEGWELLRRSRPASPRAARPGPASDRPGSRRDG